MRTASVFMCAQACQGMGTHRDDVEVLEQLPPEGAVTLAAPEEQVLRLHQLLFVGRVQVEYDVESVQSVLQARAAIDLKVEDAVWRVLPGHRGRARARLGSFNKVRAGIAACGLQGRQHELRLVKLSITKAHSTPNVLQHMLYAERTN